MPRYEFSKANSETMDSMDPLMDPTERDILEWTWRPVLELGLASKDSFVYLLHLLPCHFKRDTYRRSRSTFLMLAFNQYNDKLTPCR